MSAGIDRARRDSAEARRRTEEQERILEDAERHLADEERKERKARRARQVRMTERQLRDLEGDAPARLSIDFAVDELRDMVLSAHDRMVLTGVRDRLDDYERDLIERLLAMTAPRSEP